MNQSRDSNNILSRNLTDHQQYQLDDAAIGQNTEGKLNLKRCDSEVFENTELIQKAVDALQIESTKRSFSQVKNINDLLEQMEFFMVDKERYSQKLIEKNIYNLKYCFLEKGQTILNPRQKNKYMYILIQGSLVQKELNSNHQEPLDIGNQFGQQVRFNPSASDTSYIETERDCEFIIFNKQSYFNLVGLYEKKDIFDKVQFLVKYPFCVNWNFDSLKYMQMDMSIVKFKKGQVVFAEDSVRDNIFMVKSGEFKLLKPIIFQNKSQQNQTPLSLKIRQSIEICKLEIGDIFGEEINLINEKPKRIFRAVCADSKSEAYVFDYSKFREYLTANQSESLYQKCVEQIYQQRLSLTEQKVSQKSKIMQNTRIQMAQSRSCDSKLNQAICHAIDEQGQLISNNQDSNFHNRSDSYSHTQNNPQYQSLDNLNQKLNGEKSSSDNYLQIEPQAFSLMKIKSQQQFCAHLILQSQNKSNNFNNSQISHPSSISQSQSQSQFKQMITQSSLSKLSARLRQQSDLSNSTVNTLQISSDQSSITKSPQKKPITAYPIIQDKTNPSTVNYDAQNNDINQQNNIQSKPKLLKIKQIKQQSSSISQNINFFKEQQNKPINCITIFEQLDQFSKPQPLPTQIQQEIQANAIYQFKDIQQFQYLQQSPLPDANQHKVQHEQADNPLNFKSQVQFFDILSNYSQIQKSGNLHQKNNKVSSSQLLEQSFRKENTDKIQINPQEQEQEDDFHRDSLKSKLHPRKRAITLSPTKKQLKDKFQSTITKSTNMFTNNMNTIETEEERIVNKQVKEQGDNFNQSKNVNTNHNVIQSEISTKNTSRQSTSSYCRAQLSTETNQLQIKPNIFYFNSHYLHENNNRISRLPITKKTTINNLQKMISLSQNLQKSIDQTQNKSNQDQSIDVTKVAHSFNKSFTQIDGKNIIQIDKYKIKIKDHNSSISGYDNHLIKNKSNKISLMKQSNSISPQKNNTNTSNSNLTINLKRANQNQLSSAFSRQKEIMNSTGYIHFPQTDMKKIKLPSKKITEILQIKTFEE